eukprot:NODE_1083_length_1289_cov_145.029032_g888_i0.p1 GENE.NODE_1083_length_1289_cov_145.029032_g888_i0~~NODE_1083_length_1289_cov_145.029032_g888_i0.p1  ORF type:complete len:237 (+),score=42.50 NODE_1083_length_1289_cov_145.029032_g888_i0:275-985(+)
MHLATSSLLENLHMSLPYNQIGELGVKALHVLRHFPCLHTLDLNLSANKIGDLPIPTLAYALHTAPNLLSLRLSMSFCNLGPDAAHALADLSELRRLVLDLSHNRLGAVGAMAISLVCDAPHLSSLDLSLAANGLGKGSIWQLARHAGLGLHRLRLDLTGNYLHSKDAASLAILADSPTLSRLEINLSCNNIGQDGAERLAYLGSNPRMDSKIALVFNDVSDLSTLPTMPHAHFVM